MTVQELMPIHLNSSLASWQHMQEIVVIYVYFSLLRCEYKPSFCIEIFHVGTLNIHVKTLLLKTFCDQLCNSGMSHNFNHWITRNHFQ